MKKRILTLALALCVCLSLVPTAAFAAGSDFIIQDGVLTRYKGPGGDVVIPDGVTEIGNDEVVLEMLGLRMETIWGAFERTDVTSVTIPDSVTSIGDYAFSYCTSLTSITIPGSVTSIGVNAFSECTSLTSVAIPEGVTRIGTEAFQNCSKLERVDLPSSVAEIGEGAFHNSMKSTSEEKYDEQGRLIDIEIVTLYPPLLRLTVYGAAGSYGEGWCADNDIPFTAIEAPGQSVGEKLPQSAAISGTGTAYPSTQTVLVDGKPVEFHAYALKDEGGNDTNYIKLRDVAAILNGTAAQFEVGWDGSIAITTGAAYTPNGSENIANFSGEQNYAVNASPVKVNGVEAALEAITLTDSSGGGFTYFKLRDLGSALGFTVDWNATDGIIIQTTK